MMPGDKIDNCDLNLTRDTLIVIGRNQISASQAALGKISSAGRRIGFLGYSRAVSCLM